MSGKDILKYKQAELPQSIKDLIHAVEEESNYRRLMWVLTKLRELDVPNKAEIYDRVVDVENNL